VVAGTSERVLLLSGSLHAVLTSVFLMLEKLPKENTSGGGARASVAGVAAAKPREDTVSRM
jgi:RNA-binding protein Nova